MSTQLKPVTVVTPCRNAADYITDCIESVAAHGDLVQRHIVMDGGSDDGTVDLLENAAQRHPRLTYVSAPDNGQADALQKALPRIETQFFAWLNADDYYVDRGLNDLLAVASQPAAADRYSIIYGDYINVDQDRAFLSLRHQPTFNHWDCVHNYLTVLNAAALFNTAMTREVGGFDPTLRFAMDVDLVYKLGSRGTVSHSDSVVAAFRRHDLAKTSTMMDVCDEEVQRIRIQHSSLPVKFHSLARRWAKLRVVNRMFWQGCFACRLPLLKQRYRGSFPPLGSDVR